MLKVKNYENITYRRKNTLFKIFCGYRWQEPKFRKKLDICSYDTLNFKHN